MKYQVTYRLMHAEYLPNTAMLVVDACTHRELSGALAKVVDRWRRQGYAVRIINVTSKEESTRKTYERAARDNPIFFHREV